MDHKVQPLNLPSPQPNPTRSGGKASRVSRRAVLIGTSWFLGASLCLGATAAIPDFVHWLANTQSSRSSVKPLHTYHGFFIDIAWSPDGKRIASSGHSVQVWDAFTGALAFTCPDATNQAFTLSSGVTWSPDGQFIAASLESRKSKDDTNSIYTIQVWKASNGEHIFTYTSQSGNTLGDVSWSPDGKHIAFTDTYVKVWNISTNVLIHTQPVSASGVSSTVKWSPDGKRLLYVYTDINTDIVESWNAVKGNDIIVYTGGSGGVIDHAAAWSPDSQYLVGSELGEATIWNASTGQVLSTYEIHWDSSLDSPAMHDLEWPPDGKRIASASNDKTVEICDAMTGKNVFTYTGHSDSVISVAWSPDGKYIASVSDDGTMQIWSPG